MNKYVVAVSGGVDSVVLLDILVHQPETELIVAHFDHGIRDESHLDAVFVSELAKKYGLPFVSKREELGVSASEEKARDQRYAFLRSVAKERGAKLVTAHHADDVIESIAINLSRGTGWRGLAVLDSDIVRPLTNMSKSETINYAKKHNLQWREDSTNSSDVYLRNRIRRKTADLDEDTKSQFLCLWVAQKSIKAEIEKEASKLIGEGPTYSRYFFSHLDDRIGSELLRYVVKWRLTRPQRVKALHAIKTFLPGKTYLAGWGIEIHFTSRNFTVKLIK
ncbi:MAG TPA: tRNA lysidine(34) synthetase TilS [Candidatus Saccharimonadales bacterium]|nr:tRNA lysidine(34) synthetase TilS [Candidatus Saccharimonadales bacterium]